MKQIELIPMFPLTLLPLPGELVPLHIFEPRYKQLLQDAEANDTEFGIYFNHVDNKEKIGSVVRLESVIKRYSNGEADIIVKCTDIISMDKLYRTYRNKLYPGGDVKFWEIKEDQVPGVSLHILFLEYLLLRNITGNHNTFNIFQIANELNMDLNDRYRFLTINEPAKESFLSTRLKFQIHILRQEDKTKNVFHLN